MFQDENIRMIRIVLFVAKYKSTISDYIHPINKKWMYYMHVKLESWFTLKFRIPNLEDPIIRET